MKVLLIYSDIEKVSSEYNSILDIDKYSSTFWANTRTKDLAFKWSRLKKFDIDFEYVKDSSDLSCLHERLVTSQYKKIIYWNSRLVFTAEEVLSKILLKTLLYEDDCFIEDTGRLIPFGVTSHNVFLAATRNKNQVEIEDLYSTSSNKTVLKDEDPVLDLSVYDDLISFFQKRYNIRFFNQLSSDAYSIIKKSSDKNKMKKEFYFHEIIPSDLKPFFAIPSDYFEDQEVAGYKIEKFNFLDTSIQWLFGGWKTNDFNKFLNKLLFFGKARLGHSDKDRGESFKELYINKVKVRLDLLKNTEYISKLESIVSLTKWNTIDNVFENYFQLLKSVKVDEKHLTFTHGDPCFSNILYDKRTNVLKLIDPKGAVEKSEAYMHYTYDFAKISHSILGDYDFINNGLFSIEINSSMMPELKIEDTNLNRTELKTQFKNMINELNISLRDLRVFELSLFLSMLPLHLDNERKVTGLFLNALNIIEEIEKDL